MTPPEKRKSPRIRRRVKVILAEAGQQRTGTTSNLSLHGITIHGSVLLTQGDEVQGWIVLPTVTVPFRAEIRWAKKPASDRSLAEQHSAGLRFVGPPDTRYVGFVTTELATSADRASGSFAALPPAAPPPRAASVPPAPPAPPPRAASVPPAPPAPPPRAASVPPAPPTPPALSTPLATAGPAARMPAPISRPPPIAGVAIDAETYALLGAADLAPADTPGQHTLSLRRATELVEETLILAMASRSLPELASVGIELAVVVDPEPVGAGLRVRIAASTVQQTPDRQSFFVVITDGARTLARARYVRRLVVRGALPPTGR